MTFAPQPSSKAEVVEQMITSVMGRDRRGVIMSHRCMTCQQPMLCRTCNQPEATHTGHAFMPFRDSVSLREYSLSGMCQRCQDSVFNTEP